MTRHQATRKVSTRKEESDRPVEAGPSPARGSAPSANEQYREETRHGRAGSRVRCADPVSESEDESGYGYHHESDAGPRYFRRQQLGPDHDLEPNSSGTLPPWVSARGFYEPTGHRFHEEVSRRRRFQPKLQDHLQDVHHFWRFIQAPELLDRIAAVRERLNSVQAELAAQQQESSRRRGDRRAQEPEDPDEVPARRDAQVQYPPEEFSSSTARRRHQEKAYLARKEGKLEEPMPRRWTAYTTETGQRLDPPSAPSAEAEEFFRPPMIRRPLTQTSVSKLLSDLATDQARLAAAGKAPEPDSAYQNPPYIADLHHDLTSESTARLLEQTRNDYEDPTVSPLIITANQLAFDIVLDRFWKYVRSFEGIEGLRDMPQAMLQDFALFFGVWVVRATEESGADWSRFRNRARQFAVSFGQEAEDDDDADYADDNDDSDEGEWEHER